MLSWPGTLCTGGLTELHINTLGHITFYATHAKCTHDTLLMYLCKWLDCSHTLRE